MTDKGRQLWREEVAALLGVKDSTVSFSASKTRRTPKAQRTACDMPLPGGRRRRQITTTGGHARTVTSPWWWEADVQACLAARRDAGVLDLDRGPGGQFTKAAS